MKKIKILTIVLFVSLSNSVFGISLKDLFIEKPTKFLAKKIDAFGETTLMQSNSDGEPIVFFKNDFICHDKDSGAHIFKEKDSPVKYLKALSKFIKKLDDGTPLIIESDIIDSSTKVKVATKTEYGKKYRSKKGNIGIKYLPKDNNITPRSFRIPNKKAYGVVIGSYVVVLGAISAGIYKLISYIKNKKIEKIKELIVEGRLNFEIEKCSDLKTLKVIYDSSLDSKIKAEKLDEIAKIILKKQTTIQAINETFKFLSLLLTTKLIGKPIPNFRLFRIKIETDTDEIGVNLVAFKKVT